MNLCYYMDITGYRVNEMKNISEHDSLWRIFIISVFKIYINISISDQSRQYIRMNHKSGNEINLVFHAFKNLKKEESNGKNFTP